MSLGQWVEKSSTDWDSNSFGEWLESDRTVVILNVKSRIGIVDGENLEISLKHVRFMTLRCVELGNAGGSVDLNSSSGGKRQRPLKGWRRGNEDGFRS